MIISGFYNYATETNKIISCNAFTKTVGDNYACIACNKNDLDPEVLADSFLNKGIISVNNNKSGMFLMVVYKGQSLHLISDIYSSPWNMYYTETEVGFYYSTSLRTLLTLSEIKRNVNLTSARIFLQRGFLIDNNTLIKGVNRLSFAQEVIVKKNGYKVNHYKYKLDNTKLSTEEAEKQLLPTIESSIQKYIPKDGSNVYMPLSNGFDSNLILNTVRKYHSSDIHVFTIGGSIGRNEIPKVRKNIVDFANVHLHTFIVDEELLKFFPDIVWRLEGALYEGGVFLQYALGRIAKETGASMMLCGECADEYLKQTYQNDMRLAITGRHKANVRFYPRANPFLSAHCIILKKSALMMNSFNIPCSYPYVSNKLSNIADNLKKENGFDKALYKELCCKKFPEVIAANVKSTGGSTDEQAILSIRMHEILKSFVNESDLIQKIALLKYNTKQYSWKNEYIRILTEYPELNKVYKITYATINYIVSNMNSLYGGRRGLPEDSMSQLLTKLYLIIFEELFISGKYDNRFKKDEFPTSLFDLLKDIDK